MTSQTRWLDRLRGRETKASRTRRLVALTSAGRPRWTPTDYRALAQEGYARNAVAYRCIRMIAEATASMRLFDRSLLILFGMIKSGSVV